MKAIFVILTFLTVSISAFATGNPYCSVVSNLGEQNCVNTPTCLWAPARCRTDVSGPNGGNPYCSVVSGLGEQNCSSTPGCYWTPGKCYTDPNS